MAGIHVSVPTLQTILTSCKHTILQVENNCANAELVRQFIALHSDIKLVTSINGLHGYEMAQSLQPDMILLDMRVSCANGLDVFALLREDVLTAHIPVIILSSNAFLGEGKKCLDAGAFGYLTKPYKLKDLMEVIVVALRHAKAHRSVAEIAFTPAAMTVVEQCLSRQPPSLGEGGHIHL
ncbi:response regulator [Rhodoferax sp.]|uniref:response regulator n=1 Tax=Rhodoferax sp. TaxID=50421 RepID=UPI002851E8C3|nr:response regulator [Rhodoferax sp.]MDR3371914.1 response regulator [Rhodoferax sp.]